MSNEKPSPIPVCNAASSSSILQKHINDVRVTFKVPEKYGLSAQGFVSSLYAENNLTNPTFTIKDLEVETTYPEFNQIVQIVQNNFTVYDIIELLSKTLSLHRKPLKNLAPDTQTSINLENLQQVNKILPTKILNSRDNFVNIANKLLEKVNTSIHLNDENPSQILVYSKHILELHQHSPKIITASTILKEHLSEAYITFKIPQEYGYKDTNLFIHNLSIELNLSYTKTHNHKYYDIKVALPFFTTIMQKIQNKQRQLNDVHQLEATAIEQETAIEQADTIEQQTITAEHYIINSLTTIINNINAKHNNLSTFKYAHIGLKEIQDTFTELPPETLQSTSNFTNIVNYLLSPTKKIICQYYNSHIVIDKEALALYGQQLQQQQYYQPPQQQHHQLPQQQQYQQLPQQQYYQPPQQQQYHQPQQQQYYQPPQQQHHQLPQQQQYQQLPQQQYYQPPQQQQYHQPQQQQYYQPPQQQQYHQPQQQQYYQPPQQQQHQPPQQYYQPQQQQHQPPQQYYQPQQQPPQTVPVFPAALTVSAEELVAKKHYHNKAKPPQGIVIIQQASAANFQSNTPEHSKNRH